MGWIIPIFNFCLIFAGCIHGQNRVDYNGFRPQPNYRPEPTYRTPANTEAYNTRRQPTYYTVNPENYNTHRQPPNYGSDEEISDPSPSYTNTKPPNYGSDDRPRPAKPYNQYRPNNPTVGQNDCKTRGYNCQFDPVYPNIDGSCNNKEHPLWGATDTPHVRLLPADYGFGDAPRSHSALPTAREVTNALRETRKVFSETISNLHVLWGQMLSHDVARTPMSRTKDGTFLDCNCAQPDTECLNIRISRNDEQFREKRCFELFRSRKAEGVGGCSFSQREQINDCSSFIDGTQVYGKTERETNVLRDPYTKGKLRARESPLLRHHDLLPTQDQIPDRQFSWSMDCPRRVHEPRNVSCFVAGDVRANENTGLASLQTVWMRYHNKVAGQLEQINPHWNSNKVFNEARMIVIALMQIITYREYLPLLLGPDYMRRFGLNLVRDGYWNGYDPSINPTVANAFTTASFRYGHSQLADKLPRKNSQFGNGPGPVLELEDSFFNTEPLLRSVGEGVGSFMRGFMSEKAEKMDHSVVDDFRNKLFKEFGKTFGGDLFAFNIQRGRDHGLPGYNKYREMCGLAKAYRFSDMASEMPSEALRKLKSVYKSVDDIDMYSGAISERGVRGGQLGPAFAYLIANGFRALRKGDRFWHEHERSPARFTPEQLAELRRLSFASVLCDVTEYMHNIFEFPLKQNRNAPKLNCDREVATLDIRPWKERPGRRRHAEKYQSREWTRWFVTEKRPSRYEINTKILESRIRRENGDEICNHVLDNQVRHVGVSYAHVRFACQPGTIRATDFPHQISDYTYWTDWAEAQKIGYDDGYSVLVRYFQCPEPIAIQARTLFGDKFARETGDVFEEYSLTTGFTCRHSQQVGGRCEAYVVRLLCAKPKYSKMIAPDRKKVFLVPTTGSVGQRSYVPYYFSRRDAVSSPIKPRFTEEDTARSFCRTYSICCNFGPNWYRITHVPRSVWKEAARLCRRYHLCCDSEF